MATKLFKDCRLTFRRRSCLDELLSEFEFDFEDASFLYAAVGFGAVALVG